MVRSDQAPLHRKHDGPGVDIVPMPERHFYPETLADLIEIVRLAESMPQPPEVRAVGSGWALSEAAVTSRFVVETHKLNRTLDNVIPSCLSRASFAALTTQSDSRDGAFYPDAFNYYHVEAGVRVCDLYSRLDAASVPPIPHSTHSLEASFPALGGAWALPAQGNAGGQTIVGAFSTGTHGHRVDASPIADVVMAAHFVGPGARQYWVERTPAPGQIPSLTDDGPLRRVYPEINIIRDTQFFNALIVSVGRFGIIYSVVLRVVRQFAISERRRRTTWRIVQPFLRDSTSDVLGHRFVQVVVSPHPSADGDHACFITTAEPVGLNEISPAGGDPPGRTQRAGASACMSRPAGASATDLYAIACSAPNARAVFGPVLTLVRDVALWSLFSLPPPFNFIVAGALFGLADSVEAQLNSLPTDAPLGDLVARLINSLVAAGNTSLLGSINESLLAFGLAPRTFLDISYAVLDTFDYSDRNCLTRADSMEVMFDGQPARGIAFINFVDTLFRRVDELVRGSLRLPDGSTIDRPRAFAGYVSLRFCGRTRALLGMQRWQPTCNIEVSGLGGLDGNNVLMSVLEAVAVSLGGTVHWGQRNTLRVAQVEAVFPDLARWRDALARITENGRLATFSTQFTRDRGLEVVQPRAGSFNVAPQYYCAGETLRASWTAEQNPSGTSAAVRMTARDGTRVEQPLPRLRSGLDSSPVDVGLPVPAGTSVAQLVVSYTFAGVSREGVSAPVTVTGFDRASPPFLINGPITRRPVDGRDAWLVEVDLADELWSSALVAGNMFLAPGSAPLRVRKAGAADVLLRAPRIEVGFLSRAQMRGTWLLFTFDAARPATLGINVRVRCG